MLKFYTNASLTREVTAKSPKKFSIPRKGGKANGTVYLADKAQAKATAVAAINAVTISLDSTNDFSNIGNALVKGVTIAYTGKTASTLTGVTGLSVGVAVGDIVTPVLTYTGNGNLRIAATGRSEGVGVQVTAEGLGPDASLLLNRSKILNSETISVGVAINLQPGIEQELLDWAVEFPGLSIAENLLSYSGDLSHVPWGLSTNLTATHGQVAPDGSTTASKFVLNAAVASSGVNQTFLTDFLNRMVYDIWIKPVVGALCTIGLRDNTTPAWMPAAGQVISGPGAITGTDIQQITGLSTTQWTHVRLVTTGALTAAHTVGAYIYPAGSGTVTIGNGCYVWAPQVCRGIITLPYFKTTATPVYGFPSTNPTSVVMPVSILRRDQGLPQFMRLLPESRKVEDNTPGFIFGESRWRDKESRNAKTMVPADWSLDPESLGIEKFVSGIGYDDDLEPIELEENQDSIQLRINHGSYFNGPKRYYLPSGAVVERLTPPVEMPTATRIRSTGGTQLIKYNFTTFPTFGIDGVKYRHRIKIRNMGKTAVQVSHNFGTRDYVTIQPGDFYDYDKTPTGDSAHYAQMMLATANIADQLDVIVADPSILRLSDNVELMPIKNFAAGSGWAVAYTSVVYLEQNVLLSNPSYVPQQSYTLQNSPRIGTPVFIGTLTRDSQMFFEKETEFRQVAVLDGDNQFVLNRRDRELTVQGRLPERRLFLGCISGQATEYFSLPLFPVDAVQSVYIDRAPNADNVPLPFTYDAATGKVTLTKTLFDALGKSIVVNEPVWARVAPALAAIYETGTEDDLLIPADEVDLNPAFSGVAEGHVYLQHRKQAPVDLTLAVDKPRITVPATHESIIDLLAFGPCYYDGDFALMTATALGSLPNETVPGATLVVEPGTDFRGMINYQIPTVTSPIKLRTGGDGKANFIYTPLNGFGRWITKAVASHPDDFTLLLHDGVPFSQLWNAREGWLVKTYEVQNDNPLYGKVGAVTGYGEIAWAANARAGYSDYKTNGLRQLILNGSSALLPQYAWDAAGKRNDDGLFNGIAVKLTYAVALPNTTKTGAYFVSYVERISLKLRVEGSNVVSNTVLVQMAIPDVIFEQPWLIINDAVQGRLAQYRLGWTRNIA